MNVIGVIGVLASIALVIVLGYKGVNLVLNSLLASIIIILTNGMPFWDTVSKGYIPAFQNFVGGYFLMFLLASIYGNLMKKNGSASAIANAVFKLVGVHWAAVACIFVTALMAYGGISAFVIVFAIYPVALPLFEKANISKNLMPAIFTFGAVTLMQCLPGAPTGINATAAAALGTNAYAGPIVGTICAVVGTILASAYVLHETKKLSAGGEGFTASEEDKKLAAETNLPSFATAIIPLLAVVVVMLLTKSIFTTMNAVNTSLTVGILLTLALNFKNTRNHMIKDIIDGLESSYGTLLATAALMGFGGVVQFAPAFQVFADFAHSLSGIFSPYIAAALSLNVFTGITATSLGGLTIFVNTMLQDFITPAVNLSGFHRILAIAAGGLDTLPHCAMVATMMLVCGVHYKQAYKHVFVLSVIIPLTLTALAIALVSAGIV
jgi:H+/gluconate symporter-like permease